MEFARPLFAGNTGKGAHKSQSNEDMEHKHYTAEEAYKAAVAEIVKHQKLAASDEAEIRVEETAIRHHEDTSSYWMNYGIQRPHPFKPGAVYYEWRIVKGTLPRFRRVGPLWSHWKLG